MTSPLTPPDCDLTDFKFMPVEIGRMLDSGFNAMMNDTAWRAGVTLWFKSWHQVPAASLPDDDVRLANLAGFGRDLKAWRKIKAEAMRGWVACDDGLLYHPVVAEKALEAWVEKLGQALSSGAGNAKQWGAPFDGEAILQQIRSVMDRLRVLNPGSKTLKKAKKWAPQKPPVGSPAGTAADIPRTSQGTGTGTGTKSGEGISTDTPSPDGAYDFAMFVSLYPKRDGLAAAEREWEAAIERGANGEEIIAGLRGYLGKWKREGTEPRYKPKAANWLREDKWRDRFPIDTMLEKLRRWPETNACVRIRQAVVAAKGEDFARSYLDLAEWDSSASPGAILAATSTAVEKLRTVPDLEAFDIRKRERPAA